MLWSFCQNLLHLVKFFEVLVESCRGWIWLRKSPESSARSDRKTRSVLRAPQEHSWGRECLICFFGQLWQVSLEDDAKSVVACPCSCGCCCYQWSFTDRQRCVRWNASACVTTPHDVPPPPPLTCQPPPHTHTCSLQCMAMAGGSEVPWPGQISGSPTDGWFHIQNKHQEHICDRKSFVEEFAENAVAKSNTHKKHTFEIQQKQSDNEFVPFKLINVQKQSNFID